MIRLNLTAQKFGRLLVLRRGGTYISPCKTAVSKKWICRCDCGNITEVIAAHLREGRVKSCGCLQRERAAQAATKHGMSNTKVYWVWSQMRDRCTNANSRDYPYYGGRGISVCERWLKFENFIADMGVPPSGLTLDRKDNDGNYEPGNCRWATRAEQTTNKRAWGAA